MNKNILAIGISFLFVLTILAHMTLGYEISNSFNNLLNEDFYSDKDIHRSVFECFSTEEIPDFFKYQSDDFYLNQGSAIVELKDHFEPINQKLEAPMDSPWPMYCHDVQHTGRSPYSTSGNAGFNKWWYKCKYYIEGSAAIDNDGTIYFGGAEENVKATTIYFYALFPNGTLKWKCEVDWFIEAGPAIADDGTIYAGDSSHGGGRLYSISPNGKLKWKYQTFGEMYSSPVIGPDGTIFVGDGNNYINAINPNGTLKWKYKTGFKVYSSPAIGEDGTVYCGSHDNYLYALYPNNGTLKWKYKTGHWIRTSPCIGDDGIIYCVSLDGYLHALYPNGTCKWKTKVGGGTSPTIGHDGTIYCGWDRLHAVNPVDGSFNWSFNPGSGRCIEGATPCNSAEGTIYLGTRIDPAYGGEIIAVTPYGTEKWREMIANEYVDFAPVIGEDGTVYIGSSTMEETRSGAFQYVGYLFAFNEKDFDAPYDPIITGPKNVDVKTEINYSFQSTSPLGNDVFYWIDWGDGDWKRDIWVGHYGSGEEAIISHTWSEHGDYTIRCRSKDSDNLWSDWSKFKVTIPRNQVTHSSIWLEYLDMFPILQRIFAFIK